MAAVPAAGMNTFFRVACVTVAWILGGPGDSVGAGEPAPVAAGHWAGSIVLPNASIEVRIELVAGAGDSWSGSIDMPAQGVRAFTLSAVKIDGASAGFAMAGVPGEPTFAGRLSADGTELAGEFTQGGARFPFALKRTEAARAAPVIPPGIPGDGLAGHWLGLLRPAAGLELRLALEVLDTDPAALNAMVISLDQQNARIPVTRLSEREGAVRIEVHRGMAMVEGRLNADGSELAGTWTQGGRTTPLVFKRQETGVATRMPQEPLKPYPYLEHDVKVENPGAGVTLAGTLTVPPGAGPYPAVVLITGSGPQDRDEQVAGHRPFLVLADHLTRAGIAVLRCDDRGVGRSTGTFGAALQADFVSDTLAAVGWLRGRRVIDATRIGLIGHSEGAMVAARAAVSSPAVAFIVLLGGPGLPLEQILLRQARDIGRAMGMSESFIEQNVAAQRKIIGILLSDRSADEANAAVRKVVDEQLASLSPPQRKALGETNASLRMAQSPWFRDILRVDPAEALRAVRCPVLALIGEKDLQVSPQENLAAIRAALHAGANERVSAKELPGLNHFLQTARRGRPEETFSPVALNEISQWILETVRVATGEPGKPAGGG